MNKYNRDIIKRAVNEAALKLDGVLPELPSHPHGRIPKAHLYQVMTDIFGKSLEDVRDVRLGDCLEIIQLCVKYSQIIDVASHIRHQFDPEPVTEETTIDKWFI
jgi:hypothetical protein